MRLGTPVYALLITLGVIPLSLAQNASQSPDLDQHIEQFTIENESFLQALVHLASRAQIPMGLKWVENQAAQKPIRQTFSDSTVAEILKKLLQAQGYKSDIRNGVVHVYPTGSLEDGNDFLNIYLDKFDVNNQFVAMASHQLKVRIRSYLQPPDPVIFGKPTGPGQGVAGTITSGMGDREISLAANHVLVRDVLDKFALASDSKIWIVTYPPHNGLAFGRIKRTKSLYTKNEVPDTEQPVWTFIVWGNDPVSQSFRQDWYKRKMVTGILRNFLRLKNHLF